MSRAARSPRPVARRAEAAGRLLLVGFGPHEPQYLEAAHRRGLSVSVVDAPETLESDALRSRLRDGDRVYAIAGNGEHAWYAAALRARLDAEPDAVIAAGEPHVLPAALVADELGLRGPGLRASVVSRNKSLQRSLFAAHDLPQTAFYVAHGPDDAAGWAHDRYPVVGKPLSKTGSFGVRVLADAGELRAWAESAPALPFLVEEYVPGPERSCEVVIANGRVAFASLTEKVTTPPPFCVELQHVVPALPDEPHEAIAALAQRVATALGVDAAIMHLEVKLAPAGPSVVEVAVRAAGDFIMEAVELARGVDLFDAHLAAVLGETPDVTPRRNAVAATWFAALPPGRIAEVVGRDAVARGEGTRRVVVWRDRGDEVGPLEWSMDRAAVVVLGAPDRETLAERLRVARSELQFDMEGIGRVPGARPGDFGICQFR